MVARKQAGAGMLKSPYSLRIALVSIFKLFHSI